jgi:hypothetical protein
MTAFQDRRDSSAPLGGTIDRASLTSLCTGICF